MTDDEKMALLGEMLGKAKIGQLIVDNHGTVTYNEAGEAQIGKTKQGTMPNELMTDEAQALLQKLRDIGRLNEAFQPIGLASMPEVALLASVISQTLWNTRSWKPFEKLWACEYLSQNYQKALNEPKSKELLDVFKREAK